VIASGDGYAARDILAHDACLAMSTAAELRDVDEIIDRSGLGRPLPASSIATLEEALAASEAVIMRGMAGQPSGADV